MALRYLYGYNTSTSETCFNQKNYAILNWKIPYFVRKDEQCEQVYRPVLLFIVTVQKLPVSVWAVLLTVFLLNSCRFVLTHEPRNALKSLYFILKLT